MVIYVEYVIIDNMVIDCLILLTVKRLALQKAKKWRILLSSIFGTAFALISPIVPSLVNLLCKPLVAVLMVAIAFGQNNAKKFCILLVLFFLSTFVYGGACLGICEMLGIKYIVQSGAFYEYKFPIGFALLVCFLTYICAKNIIRFCHKKHSKDNLLFEVKFQNLSRTKRAVAFLDTGNCVELENRPITIVNFEIFESLFPKISISDILMNKNCIEGAKYIQICSIGNMQEKMLVVQIEKMSVEKIVVKNALLGLSLGNFSSKTNSDAIISKKILNMGEKNEF